MHHGINHPHLHSLLAHCRNPYMAGKLYFRTDSLPMGSFVQIFNLCTRCCLFYTSSSYIVFDMQFILKTPEWMEKIIFSQLIFLHSSHTLAPNVIFAASGSQFCATDKLLKICRRWTASFPITSRYVTCNCSQLTSPEWYSNENAQLKPTWTLSHTQQAKDFHGRTRHGESLVVAWWDELCSQVRVVRRVTMSLTYQKHPCFYRLTAQGSREAISNTEIHQ